MLKLWNPVKIDKEILEEIRREVPIDKYGHKELIWNPIYANTFTFCPSTNKKRGECKDGYDCVDASLKTKEILKNHGIKSSLKYGTSEDGLFPSETGHKFVMADSTKEIIDAIPLYHMVGARHIVNGRIPNEKLSEIEDVVDLRDFVLDFRENDDCQYLVTGHVRGIFIDKNIKKTDRVQISIGRKRKQPEEVYTVVAYLNEERLMKFLDEQKPITRDYSFDESKERLEKLSSGGAIKIKELGWDLNLEKTGTLKDKPKDNLKVSEDLKEELQENMRDFVHLIETIPLI